MPRIYRCTSASLEKGYTCYVAARQPARAGPRLPWEIQDDGARIFIVETDNRHAVIWTEPEDLQYEPAAPGVGLGRHHRIGFLAEEGALAGFSDGTVRFIPAMLDPELFGTLLSGKGSEQTGLAFPWYTALFMKPVGRVLLPPLLIGVWAIGGGLLIGYRLLRRGPISPGEFLWLIAGTEYLALLIAASLWYRYEVAPVPDGNASQQVRLWLLPALAGIATSTLAARRFRSFPGGQAVFFISALLFSLIAVNTLTPEQHRSLEEAFVTAVCPVLLASVGGATVLLTATSAAPAGLASRRLVHWIGVAVSFLPFAWFLMCLAQGLVFPRALFVRVLD
jgi:hypothetical protein